MKKSPQKLIEWFIEKGIAIIAFASFAAILLICIFIFKEAVPLFFHYDTSQAVASAPVGESESYGEPESNIPQVPDKPELQLEQEDNPVGLFDLLLGNNWQPVSLTPAFGLIPLFLGAMKITLIALLFAAPISILAALYTSTFAPKAIKEFIKPIIEILAGFPSVVIGFFALIVLASVMQNIFGFHYRLNALVGGIAMSLAVIPIIYTISEDAIAAVPKSFTEASLALGAQKWESVLFVVLPAATPGIFASILLGIGRAFGETMIVLMATGNAAMLTFNVLDPTRTFSATIGAEMAEVVFGDTHYSVLFFIGVLLFLFSFALNSFVELFIRQRLMKRFTGA